MSSKYFEVRANILRAPFVGDFGVVAAAVLVVEVLVEEEEEMGSSGAVRLLFAGVMGASSFAKADDLVTDEGVSDVTGLVFSFDLNGVRL